MIPLTPGDIAKAVSAVGKIIELIQRPERANKLAKWAEFLKPEPTDEEKAKAFARERLLFLQNLMQDLGFTPWYEYTTTIPVPKDVLCDIVDLLVCGPSRSKVGWLRMLVGEKKPKDDYEEWADLIQRGKPEDILDYLKALVARNGRTRHYADGGPAIAVDLDWLADCGMCLLSQG